MITISLTLREYLKVNNQSANKLAVKNSIAPSSLTRVLDIDPNNLKLKYFEYLGNLLNKDVCTVIDEMRNGKEDYHGN